MVLGIHAVSLLVLIPIFVSLSSLERITSTELEKIFSNINLSRDDFVYNKDVNNVMNEKRDYEKKSNVSGQKISNYGLFIYKGTGKTTTDLIDLNKNDSELMYTIQNITYSTMPSAFDEHDNSENNATYKINAGTENVRDNEENTTGALKNTTLDREHNFDDAEIAKNMGNATGSLKAPYSDMEHTTLKVDDVAKNVLENMNNILKNVTRAMEHATFSTNKDEMEKVTRIFKNYSVPMEHTTGSKKKYKHNMKNIADGLINSTLIIQDNNGNLKIVKDDMKNAIWDMELTTGNVSNAIGDTENVEDYLNNEKSRMKNDTSIFEETTDTMKSVSDIINGFIAFTENVDVSTNFNKNNKQQELQETK